MLTVSRVLRSMRLGREEGQILPIFAAAILGVLAMTGVVVDGGNLFQSRQSLQNAADAAALAAGLYLADPTKSCQGGGVAACAGIYAGLNGVKNPDGSVTTQLDTCPGTVTATSPPPDPPGCYVYPYTPPGASNSGYVEVWLTQKTSNFFGGLLGFGSSTVSARAVGAPTAGNPPPITFAALNNDPSCPNHTLLIKLGGNLVVNSGIYVNSCNQGDGFDIFGGGSITAPKIETNGGWETHDASTVYVPAGTLCSFPPNKSPDWHVVSGPPPTYPLPPNTPAGCPDIGVPPVGDPFANYPPAPNLGPGNIGPPVGITKISRAANGNKANIAEVVTQTPDGLAVGDLVSISGVGYGFDGTYPVLTVNSTTDFTYDNSKGSDGCGKAPCPTIPAITQEQMTGGVATLTTNAPDTLAVNDTVTVSGLSVNGSQAFFNVTNGIVTGTGLSSFSFDSPLGSRTFTVSKKQLQHGTAALTVNSSAGLAAGDTVNVTLSPTDALIPDGSYVVAGVGGGCIGGQSICFTVPPAPPIQLDVTKKSIKSTTTAVLSVPNNFVAVGDQITVNLGDPNDSRFDGTFTATAANGGGGGTVSYTIPAVTANIAQTGAAAGVVTLQTSSSPYEANDTVSVAGPLAYANSSVKLPATFNPSTNTFTYTSKTFKNVSWTMSGTSITATTASAHGLNPGDNIKVGGAPGGGSCSGTFPVTAVTATTFTYTVTTACVPGTSGTQQYNIQVWDASSAAASGTVTLTTMPAINTTPSPCVGCITVPAAEAPVAASGSAVLTDVPATAVSGTFTPAWMPTFGVTVKNFPGSPGIPSPDVISTGTVTLQPGTYYGGICIGVAAGLDCGSNSKPANCLAAGGSTTTVQSYSPTVTLAASIGDATATGVNTTIQVTPSGVIATGDVISIDDEEMSVTGVSGATISVTREWNGTQDAAHTAGTEIFQVVTAPNGTPYNPAVKLSAAITATDTTIPVNSSAPVGVGDIIQIDNEAMTVTAIPDGTHLTVTRGTYSTTPTSHANGAPVLEVFNASAPPPPTVTLAKGVYIMAGGGFNVCGAANLDTPDGVMIYNTNDPSVPTGYGALGQVDINTAGSVQLQPMTDGTYAGLTIFQDRSLTLVPGANCGGKSSASQWDIALQSAAPLPSSGALGSISGTIYAPHLGADFGDSMSGVANLAVITSCIYINGADSTFNHDTSGGALFGVTATLGG